MPTLKEDIKTQSEWIVNAFKEDGYKLDYTLDSIIEIDRFFAQNVRNGKAVKGGRLAHRGYGSILFSIGAYVGETIIKNINHAEWITDDEDPQGELNVSLKLPDESEIWPIQRVMKRFQSDSQDSIYPYVHAGTKEFSHQPFNEKYWNLTTEIPAEEKKPWWKFW
jgi:hypothetical protein